MNEDVWIYIFFVTRLINTIFLFGRKKVECLWRKGLASPLNTSQPFSMENGLAGSLITSQPVSTKEGKSRFSEQF